jgi:Fe-S-cluster containining protein
MNEPWYHAGLRFECTRCGACCTGEPGFVWVEQGEMEEIAAFLGEKVEEAMLLYSRPAHRGRTLREKVNGDCVFFNPEKGCTIYPVRPRQCRTWPFWESNVRTPERWEETRRKCPGAGQGELISAEEITRRLQVIRL